MRAATQPGQDGLYQSGAHPIVHHEPVGLDAATIQRIIAVAREDARQDSEPPLEQVMRHWAVQWIIRGGIALLIAIGGYAFKGTMESIENSVKEVQKTATAINGTIGRINDRVSDLEESRTKHRIYFESLHDWRDDMKQWRSEMDRHEHTRKGPRQHEH